MSENLRHLGLCMTCNNVPDCIFKQLPGKPVLYCEEFEIDSAPSVETAEQATPVTYSFDAEKESLKSMGLCCNCENLKTCGFPKPEGGVWHCEEYQ